MTQEEIKGERELLYLKIQECNDRLKEIRKICSHTNTFEGNWSYRIGNISPAIICSDCGNFIKYR